MRLSLPTVCQNEVQRAGGVLGACWASWAMEAQNEVHGPSLAHNGPSGVRAAWEQRSGRGAKRGSSHGAGARERLGRARRVRKRGSNVRGKTGRARKPDARARFKQARGNARRARANEVQPAEVSGSAWRARALARTKRGSSARGLPARPNEVHPRLQPAKTSTQILTKPFSLNANLGDFDRSKERALTVPLTG
ncbi:hypothetical protein GH714_041802 [Hevea brasiliensis]|uniref:Uncharacterized protein n=1 Tax=Hevea brasiliensis TaxID=3981 RepID=A0A6A6MRN2_HEVBR|nr:hypothetical protein GH714_041802 [Hevea brasiliensis]